MRIDYFKIYGFKAPERFAEVLFSESNATVIYGENGCGKTTFLRVLFAFLSQDESVLLQMEVTKIECVVSDENGATEVVVERIYSEDDEAQYDWGSFNECILSDFTSLSMGVERGVSSQPLRLEPRDIYEFFMNPSYRRIFSEGSHRYREVPSIRAMSEELSRHLRGRSVRAARIHRSDIDYDRAHLYLQSIKIENIEHLLSKRYRSAKIAATQRIQNALFDTLSIAIDPSHNTSVAADRLPENFVPRLVKNSDRIIEALESAEDNNFKSRIIEILGDIEDKANIEKVLENKLLCELFRNMIEELEIETLLLSSINFLVDTFNSYLIENKKLVVSESEVHVEIGDANHSVNDLSSGERHILTFLTLVLFEGQGRTMLIIDEPEISLNVKWQRELISLFSRLLPETQIVVASHAPALAKRNPQFLSELRVWRGESE